MGRRPNPLILTYFERGPKLSDNSNRYPHRCKACGEDFPKGRIDSLTNHLTKRCPAISEAERINACLALHGINGSPARRAHTAAVVQSSAALTDSVADNALSQTNWTALETLAEVSRQINEFSGKHDEHLASPQHTPHDASQAQFSHPLMALTSHPFELQEQFTLENPPLSYENRPQQEQHQLQPQDLQHEHNDLDHEQEMTEEKLRSLLESDDHALDSNLSMAAAATARLNPSYVDSQIHQQFQHGLSQGDSHDVGETPTTMATTTTGETGGSTAAIAGLDAMETVEEAGQDAQTSTDALDGDATTGAEATAPTNAVDTIAQADGMMLDHGHDHQPSTPISMPGTSAPLAAQELIPSWGELTYIPNNIQPPATVSDQSQQLAYTLNKGGFRMDTLSPNGTRVRHSRARFDPTRRKEVQEVRRIGACIRCRILRKVCSKGTPCDTCRKVLSPRVWHTGCTRTKLAEQIELYSAGVQIVVAQKRVNKLKEDYELSNNGVVIEASHFHETGHQITLQVLQGVPSTAAQETHADLGPSLPGETMMIDNGKENIPAQVENYMRRMLPEFISRETSSHVRVTLECAQQVAHDTNDELLRRSLELWGLTEIMDRERQWSFHRKSSNGDCGNIWFKDETSTNDHDNEVFTTFCTQLTAGAERKASYTSRSLLVGIQRNLQDGRTKLGFPMFLTAMIFLNCVEKMTWSFKAWDGEALRSLWPLEKQPDNYYNQGYGLCELLKMLLHIRHILPKVSEAEPDQVIKAEEEDEIVQKYYEDLNVTPNFLRSRRENFSFDQSDSRSLEFLFCSALLQP
ncbi:putative Zn(2)-C6 fungal-type domain-containing protein [Seiridium cardinale]|uniref:Zn(2)-C6 fungal-type domain-containing protein n=1 Tax=Seiridium cardinale TaxID=138064 RepID=A0ABR2XII7_9PEZI